MAGHFGAFAGVRRPRKRTDGGYTQARPGPSAHRADAASERIADAISRLTLALAFSSGCASAAG